VNLFFSFHLFSSKIFFSFRQISFHLFHLKKIFLLTINKYWNLFYLLNKKRPEKYITIPKYIGVTWAGFIFFFQLKKKIHCFSIFTIFWSSHDLIRFWVTLSIVCILLFWSTILLYWLLNLNIYIYDKKNLFFFVLVLFFP